MALIICPECMRKGVSDRAKACPDCGFPISEYPEEIKQRQTESLINSAKCANCGHHEFEHKPVSQTELG